LRRETQPALLFVEREILMNPKMKKQFVTAVALCVALMSIAQAHDLFFKFTSYFLKPNTRNIVRLLNGTFRRSENVVTRDRMVDVSLVNGKGERTHPPLTDWHDEGNTALLNVSTGEAGTYLLGLYTKPRELAMKAAAFNHYLEHEGVPDILSRRKEKGELKKDSQERYSKHVKAIFQVGDARTDVYQTVLGYPVEIIPQQNPYVLKVGRTLEGLCLKDGQPLAGQYVLAGREFNGRMFNLPGRKTNENGLAQIPLKGAGKWYVKFISMKESIETPVNYESKWATLTFEIR
jgi:uncharacterized GH25 family protein